MAISVLIVDDHEVVRLGLASLLRHQTDMTVVGQADSGRAALNLVARFRPQVVLMDVRMPDMTGVEACRAILSRWPDTRVLMLTSYSDDDAALAAIMAGAVGYLLKQVRCNELVQAIRTVAAGGSLVDPLLAHRVLNQMRSMAQGRPGDEPLTRQERQVLALLAQGKTNREIAGEMFLHEKTVRNYVSSILKKLNLANRAQAAAYATRQRILGGEE